MSPDDPFWEVIHIYSRAQALADGTLIAANPELLAQASFIYPVAYTSAVYADCIAWSDEAEPPQDQLGREWDVLFMLHFAIKNQLGGDTVSFGIRRIAPRHRKPSSVGLVAKVGPGDDAELVITVMLPGED